uniref:Uncharacterized protein n=1 Tax=Anopheles melas TaxID=34690 RepID=A0A182UAU7_9DIPT
MAPELPTDQVRNGCETEGTGSWAKSACKNYLSIQLLRPEAAHEKINSSLMRGCDAEGKAKVENENCGEISSAKETQTDNEARPGSYASAGDPVTSSAGLATLLETFKDTWVGPVAVQCCASSVAAYHLSRPGIPPTAEGHRAVDTTSTA